MRFNLHNDLVIIDCSSGGGRALSLSLNEGQVRLKNFWESSKSENLREFLGRVAIGRRAKVLFIHEEPQAATFAGLVKLEKNHDGSPLNERDFDNFLGTAVEHFFNRFREEARRKLGTDDVNIVLANNRFLNFKLDGKQVINPIGLKAKFAELEIEQTFLERNFFEQINDNLTELHNIFHIDLPGALRDILGSLYQDKKILLALAGSADTRIFGLGAKSRYFGAVSFPKIQDRGRFSWGVAPLLDSVSEKLGVTAPVAKKVLSQYASGQTSKHFERHMTKLISPRLASFDNEMKKFYKKEDAVVVVANPNFLLPNAKSALPYVSLEFKELAQKFNLEFSYPDYFNRNAFSPVLVAGLIAYLNRTGDNYLNVLARNRMRWLLPQNSA